MRDDDFWTNLEHDLEAQDDPADQGHPEALAGYCVAFLIIVVAFFLWCVVWCAVRWWHQ